MADLSVLIGRELGLDEERLLAQAIPPLQTIQIKLKARILTVADIVGSMPSDRPYLPALEMDEAIGEIAHRRGIRLDEGVLDACVEVLKRLIDAHFFGK